MNEFPDYADDVADLKRRMGGEGDVLPDAVVAELWGAFSGNFHASWLIPGDLMLGNFAGWLIRCLAAGRILDGQRTSPYGRSIESLTALWDNEGRL